MTTHIAPSFHLTRIAALPTTGGLGSQQRLEEKPPVRVHRFVYLDRLCREEAARRQASALQRARSALDLAETLTLDWMPKKDKPMRVPVVLPDVRIVNLRMPASEVLLYTQSEMLALEGLKR